MLKAMEADSGIHLSTLKVDGGASANNFLMQTEADLIRSTGRTAGMRGDNCNGSSISGRNCGRILEETRKMSVKNRAVDQTFTAGDLQKKNGRRD